MPKTAAKFGHELQAALQPMIIKPSGSGGVQVRFSYFSLLPTLIDPSKILQETVGCMCVVVQYLTHDFVRLVNLLKSCNGRFSILIVLLSTLLNFIQYSGRLQQMVKRPASQELNPAELRALIILIFIVSLLAENCNFDTLRKENTGALVPVNSLSSLITGL